jgi:hypothetical protein
LRFVRFSFEFIHRFIFAPVHAAVAQLFTLGRLHAMNTPDPKNVETSGAVYGIHIGLTMLLAIGFAAYDGLEHTYPILIGYMFFGWMIPLLLWPFVKRFVSRPVSPTRTAISRYMPPVVAMVLGPIFFLLGVFMPQSDKITVNGEVISKSDPRFAHDEMMFRVFFAGMGLLALLGGYFWFRFLRKRKNETQS